MGCSFLGTFYKNYLNFCNSIKKSPSAVALEVGLSKTAVNGWKNGRSNPTDATLEKLSNYFGCTVDDLLSDRAAFDNQPFTGNKNKPSDIGELSETELSLIQLFRALPEDRRVMVFPMLQAALQAAGLSQEQE